MAEHLKAASRLPPKECKTFSLTVDPGSVDEQGIFEGYASVSGNVDSDGDIVMPGAFRATLSTGMAKDGVPILLLHNDQRLPVGRSLALEEDEHGLRIRAQIADTTDGLDARKARPQRHPARTIHRLYSDARRDRRGWRAQAVRSGTAGNLAGHLACQRACDRDRIQICKRRYRAHA